MGIVIKFFELCIGHAVADFWAQSAEMRKAKGWDNFVMSDNVKVWPYALTAHALIHGGVVYGITGSAALGFAEFVCHWLIDYGKCNHLYNAHVDQGAHIGCKAVWSILA